MVATILYPPLKGKNIAMDKQDKTYIDPAVYEPVHTDPASPAEVTVEKEVEAAPLQPPLIEVTEAIVEKELETAKGMRVRD